MSIPHYEGSEIDQKIEDLTVEEARGKILEYYEEHKGGVNISR
jgi:hypothetical protein